VDEVGSAVVLVDPMATVDSLRKFILTKLTKSTSTATSTATAEQSQKQKKNKTKKQHNKSNAETKSLRKALETGEDEEMSEKNDASITKVELIEQHENDDDEEEEYEDDEDDDEEEEEEDQEEEANHVSLNKSGERIDAADGKNDVAMDIEILVDGLPLSNRKTMFQIAQQQRQQQSPQQQQQTQTQQTQQQQQPQQTPPSTPNAARASTTAAASRAAPSLWDNVYVFSYRKLATQSNVNNNNDGNSQKNSNNNRIYSLPESSPLRGDRVRSVKFSNAIEATELIEAADVDDEELDHFEIAQIKDRFDRKYRISNSDSVLNQKKKSFTICFSFFCSDVFELCRFSVANVERKY
jgi:hypothetical protein